MAEYNNVEDIITFTLVDELKANSIVKYEYQGKTHVTDNALHMNFTATQGDTSGTFTVVARTESWILPTTDRMHTGVKYQVQVAHNSKIYGSSIIKVIEEHVEQAQIILNNH